MTPKNQKKLMIAVSLSIPLVILFGLIVVFLFAFSHGVSQENLAAVKSVYTTALNSYYEKNQLYPKELILLVPDFLNLSKLPTEYHPKKIDYKVREQSQKYRLAIEAGIIDYYILDSDSTKWFYSECL